MEIEPLIRFRFDPTGENRNNFVAQEIHFLSELRNRCLAPRNGLYFADSLQIKELATGRYLARDYHYSCIELDQTLSGSKDIFAAVVIIDPLVTSPVEISYQAIGGTLGKSRKTLVDLLNKIQDTGTVDDWNFILNKPKDFKPQEHFHHIKDSYDHNQTSNKIDKILLAIEQKDEKYIRNLYEYFLDYSKINEQDLMIKISEIIDPIYLNFKLNLNKQFFNLNNIQNATISNSQEIDLILNKDFNSFFLKNIKYFTLKNLIFFKDIIYEKFIVNIENNLGKTLTESITPNRNTILRLKNGSINFLNSYNSLNNKEGVNLDCYAEIDDFNKTFVIIKIANNFDTIGGVYLQLYTKENKVFISFHTGKDEAFEWIELLNIDDFNKLRKSLLKHLENKNPHKVNKADVGLSELQNFNIASKEEILRLIPANKYITLEMALLFMKRFLVGKLPNNQLNAKDPTKLANVSALLGNMRDCDN